MNRPDQNDSVGRASEHLHPRFCHLDEARHDKMVELAYRMLVLHKQFPKAKTPHEQESLKRTIAATDAQIDVLVYELYGLTKDEIRIVEGA
jgi:hypothetical protein